ncbi:hypothetical protein KFL_001060160 [Klebsormidium nitens]|uniref:Dirigent protein n=1 Tax=Klebsormidium nitens TaxID=105231 RepID=A0A1Y1HVT8_KLENI|nr:hypothetical protein KFL_001060160 [Klebsormidium nitens]|eukprot:GAQ82283.1 hypothetical protein KFL_001060160 [Klebsormidium nitens]
MALSQLVLVLVLGCTALTAAQSYKELKLQFVELGAPSTQGDDGTGFGNTQFFRNPIADYNTDAILGYNSGFCGSLKDTPSAISVVGGSGIYSGATGVCQFSTLSNDGANNNVFAYNCEFFVVSTPLSPATLGPRVGVAPVNGVCNPGSSNPNQCFAADGMSSICCPGNCPGSPTNTAACA